MKKIAPVSKRFYKISRDQNLIKKIEYDPPTSNSDLFSWSEERVEKYFTDFSEILMNARKLKMLSFHWVDYQTMRKFFWNQPLVNGNCLEEFCIKFDFNISVISYAASMANCVFPFLKKCPKLKVVRISSNFLQLDLEDYNMLEHLMAKFNSESLQELHLKLYTMSSLNHEPFLQAVKNLLKAVTKNMPKLKYVDLPLHCENFNGQNSATLKNICQEFASEKKIEINIRGMFIREVQVP